MDNIKIEQTGRTPGVDFDFSTNTFEIRGESYPEDISTFYGPIIGKLEDYLSSLDGATVTFKFELIYFNSSSAKILMGLFDTLDEAAGRGNVVKIHWLVEEDDDNMEELGKEFAEDLESATFKLSKVTV
jgi:hypothetical protein